MITNYGNPKSVPGLHIFAPKSLTTSDECHYAPNFEKVEVWKAMTALG